MKLYLFLTVRFVSNTCSTAKKSKKTNPQQNPHRPTGLGYLFPEIFVFFVFFDLFQGLELPAFGFFVFFDFFQCLELPAFGFFVFFVYLQGSELSGFVRPLCPLRNSLQYKIIYRFPCIKRDS